MYCTREVIEWMPRRVLRKPFRNDKTMDERMTDMAEQAWTKGAVAQKGHASKRSPRGLIPLTSIINKLRSIVQLSLLSYRQLGRQFS